MKRYLFLLILLIAVPSEAVDIRSFSSNASPTGDDIVYCVDDPSGTPSDCKISILDLFSNIPNNSVDAGAIDGALSKTWTGTHNFATGTIVVKYQSDCSSFTTEGVICWDSDNDNLYMGTGSTIKLINDGGGSGITFTTVGSLGTCDISSNGTVKLVSDGTTAGDCATGGGSTYNLCVCKNGTGWTDEPDSTGSALGANLTSSSNQILSDTGTLSFGDDDLITTGTIQAAEFRVSGTGVSTIENLTVSGSMKIPYQSNCGVEENGDFCISTGITDLPSTPVWWGGQVMYGISIKSTDFTPTTDYAIVYDSTENGFIMKAIATALFNQSVNDITFNDTAYNLGIGGASLGTSDIILNSTGAATFNEQGANVDFRIESDTNDQAFFLEGSNGYVGVNTNAPTEQLTVNGTMKLEGNGSAHATFGQVTADCCSAAGTGECGNGSIFYSSAGKFCYCNGSGVDLFIVDDSACTY